VTAPKVPTIDAERFARSYYKCGGACMSHDYHLKSARQIIADYEALAFGGPAASEYDGHGHAPEDCPDR
jgi:hypothetical protein